MMKRAMVTALVRQSTADKARSRHSRAGQGGFTMVEMLVAMAIFSIILAGIYRAYSVQLGHLTREYKSADTEIELDIARGIIERDLLMAGFALADNSGELPAEGTNGTPDTLVLRGTELGLASRGVKGWAVVDTVDPAGITPTTFLTFNDPREDLRAGDTVIIMEPTERNLKNKGGVTLFKYHGPNNFLTYPASADPGTKLADVIKQDDLIYGLGMDPGASQTYYAAKYYLATPATRPVDWAPDTFYLARAESDTAATPTEDATNDPKILGRVLDFQVAFGLDTDKNGEVDLWDNGGASQANAMGIDDYREKVKLVRAFVLVQSGSKDSSYTYPSATVRVGDSGDGIGRDITLTDEQRRYRWKVLSLRIAPRNIE